MSDLADDTKEFWDAVEARYQFLLAEDRVQARAEVRELLGNRKGSDAEDETEVGSAAA